MSFSVDLDAKYVQFSAKNAYEITLNGTKGKTMEGYTL